MTVGDEVRRAADRLVAAFAAHDTTGYFAAFAPDATFLFHTTPGLLRSREEYQRLWQTWESDDGFHVESCRSRAPHIQLTTDDSAVFTHEVHTRLRLGGEVHELEERETIVFARRDGQWLAVHEHLSAAPSEGQ